MSWLLAFLGFALLIVSHEAGHFWAARLVGMHVERFALFFPPLVFRYTKGETEYAIGAIPLGGYCKISGMSPREELPEDIADRAYYLQKPWKKIVVIAAGPAVNLLLAIVLFAILFATAGQREDQVSVASLSPGFPAAALLQVNDQIVAVDRKTGTGRAVLDPIAKYSCLKTKNNCSASKAAIVTVRRQGKLVDLNIFPRLDQGKMRIGVVLKQTRKQLSPSQSIIQAINQTGVYAALTLEGFSRLTSKQGRDQVSGVAGSYDATRRSFDLGPALAIEIIAIISLSLAIINLLPILPLDGGHIAGAIIEWIRGKPLSEKTTTSIAIVGFLLLFALFTLGAVNDLGRLL